MTRSTKVSRRAFLIHAGTAVAAVAAPMIVPAGVLGLEDAPAANDRIGLAGIGIGRQGSGVFASAVSTKLVRPIAIADANIKRAEELCAKFKGFACQDYRKILERKDVDAIITATPDHWRAIVCIRACQAGKDVYAEKPMSLTIREGRLMAQAVRKYQRVFQTGSQQRSDRFCRLGCELIRNGKIGKVVKVIGYNYPSPWECALPAEPVPAELDWDLWCGPTPVAAYHKDLCTPRARPGWISFRPYSGGEMTGWGAHGLDQIQWALGMDESGPLELWTEGPKFDPPTYSKPEKVDRGNKLCAQSKVFFRYPGGIEVVLDNGPMGGATFIGEKGTITIDRGKCTSDPPGRVKEPIPADGVHLVKSNDHMRNWLDCIKSRQRCVADVEIGHRSATVCHLGNIARWAGRRLKWDPVRETFPDDPDARQFLDRPRREPYELPETV
jgi:predicted dehydrogenase